MFTPDGSIVDGEIVDHKNGTYEFVYIVPKEGDFSLALRLYDQHIKGSPFKLTVSKASEVEVGGVKGWGGEAVKHAQSAQPSPCHTNAINRFYLTLYKRSVCGQRLKT